MKLSLAGMKGLGASCCGAEEVSFNSGGGVDVSAAPNGTIEEA